MERKEKRAERAGNELQIEEEERREEQQRKEERRDRSKKQGIEINKARDGEKSKRGKQIA